MKMSELEFLYAALNSEFGVIISSSNLQLTKNRLYVLKREHPVFDSIALVTSPILPDRDLYLLKKAPPDATS